MVDALWQWFHSVGQFMLGPLSQIAAAFIAGGLVATGMGEWFQRGRDNKSARMARIETLVRVYQRYRRLLRQAPDKKSESDLDHLHADFLSEIKILRFEERFTTECDQLYKLSQKMANFHRGQSRPGEEGKKLNQFSQEFDSILKNILKKVRKVFS